MGALELIFMALAIITSAYAEWDYRDILSVDYTILSKKYFCNVNNFLMFTLVIN